VNGDTAFEGNETFFVSLSNAVNCSLGTITGVATILNDDVSVSINNAPSITEGDAGTIDAVFTISLSAPKPNLTLSVDYTASNNSAVQPSDYAPTTGTVAFLPGETSKTVTVAVNGDTAFEGNETFFVSLSNAVNCSLGTITGVGTILNDDVSVSINNAPAVTEGDGGTIDAVFTISLSAPKTNLTLTVDYAASNNSAVQPSDYAPASGTVTFLPGETSKTVNVAVNGDTAFEGNETFFVSLSNAVNCSLGTISGVATILNDDVAPKTTTWTGAISTAWSNPGNWTAGVPIAGDTALFSGTGSTDSVVDLTLGAPGLLSLQLTAGYGGTLSLAPGETLTAANLILSSGTLAAAGGTLVVDVNLSASAGALDLSSAVEVRAAGGLSVGGAVAFTPPSILRLTGASTTQALSMAGHPLQGIELAGSSATLSAVGPVVASGLLEVTGSANTLAGTFTLAALQVDPGVGLTTSSASAVTVLGPLSLAAGSTLSLGADLTAPGPISNLGLIALNGRRLIHAAESLAFTDATGTPVTDVFPGVDPVIATVIDGNLNLDGTQVESITSVVATTASGDAENFAGGLDLIETGPATGVFRSAALPTELSASAAAQDGLLQAVLGDTFALTYTDPTDPGDTAQAMLGTGSLPPRILATSPAPSSRVASTLMTASVSFDQEIDSATLTDATVFVAPLLPFTGDAFDAPSLDLAAWTPRPGPGIVQQVAGVLHIEQGGVPDGRARVDSRFAVDGDFDIEVGFVAQGLPVPSVGQNRIFMRLVNLADTAVVYQLSRFTEAGGADGFEFERTTGSDRVAQTPSSGRLRLQRQGSLLSAFVDAGSGFVPLGSPVPVIPGPFAVDLGVAAFGSGSGLVAADFDDFLVTAGRGFVPGAPIPTASLTYDSPTASVTLAYPAPLAPGPYVLLALSEPGGVILAPTGLALDGEPLGPLPSGDGTAGGTFFGLFTVNAPPTANAGLDQSVNEGGLVALDGSSSLDVDGDPLSFTWVQTGGPPVVLFAPATATPTFTAPAVAADATVSFQLTLSDGLESDTDTVAVVVHPLNQAPTASAGPDQSVNAGDAVTLDGSGSLDLDGDPLSYAWSQTAGPAVALAGASTAMPTFTAPAVAVNTTLTFQLSVSDGSAIGVDSVDILVQPLNQAPTANAGVNQTVSAGQTVELDASGSSDPDLGTTLTFTWTQLSGPGVSLIAGTTATPSFTAPAVSAPVRLDFEVSASDGSQSALDQVVVQVNPAPDWRQFRRDASHTAAGGYPGTLLGGSLFSVVTGGDVRSSVAQGPDGTLYFGSDDGSVYAFSQDGVLVGSEPTLGPVRQTPAVDAAGNVYVGSFDGMLYSFGPRLASTRWVFPSGGRFRFASPALGSGGTVVYAGSEDGSLYAVDAASGTQLWSQATGGAVYSSPAVDGAGNVYFGSNDGKVYALTSTGTTVAGWPVTLGSPVQSAPAIASNGTVLVGSDDGKLHALASDGTEVWAATTGGAITSSAAVAGTYVVVGSDDGAVRALDLADGAEMWSRPTGAQVRSSPAVSSDGTVYVGSCDGNLYALDLADGSDRFAFVLGGFVIASPAVGPDGVVYAGSDDDRLYAIGTRLFTGSLTVAPIVDTVWPAELRQGTTATVRVQGYHFREGMTLDLGAGISVGEVRLTSEQELEVGVVVEAGARLGEREAVATAARTLRGTRASALTVGFDCRRADLSGDGVVDGLDLALLASRFGAAGGEGADLTGDALVDGADLSLLAARFGGRSLECR